MTTTPRAKFLIDHVDSSIEKALRHESNIDEAILYLPGFSTGVMRRLVSNLCRLDKELPSYLEVGLYGGATFCAAMNNNPKLRAVGIEDFSQPFGKEDVFEKLKANLATYGPQCAMMDFINDDCFSEMAKKKVQHHEHTAPFDIYFYDGNHSFEAQRDALAAFLPSLAESFIFMVDDANWQSVDQGTKAGFDALKDRVTIDEKWHMAGEKRQDDPVWWNGVQLFVCTRK